MLIKDLERSREEVLRHFSLGETELARTRAPGKWNVRFLLHHLADAELALAERLRRIISEPGFVIWFWNQDLWAAAQDYSTKPLAESKAVFETLRNANIGLTRRHYERNGAMQWVHSQDGLRTLKDEFDKLAAHTEHHLVQIRAALT